MMISPDHKKIASIIIGMHPGKGGPTSSPEGDEEESGGGNEGLHAACEDIIQAVHDKDAEGLMSALSSFLAQHDSEEAPEEETS